jgi:hypothetical protein
MNLLRWQFTGVLLVASVVASGQTVKRNQAQPPDRDLSIDPQYRPITQGERWSWFVQSTLGPQSLTAGLLSAGFGTATNSPKEYGGAWEGFGKRYGMRLTGVSTGNAMEAGLGEFWREDPRYFRASGRPFGNRVLNIVKLTFVARRSNGNFAPAYARYIATAGNNFISNTWRAHSEADAGHAILRTLLGFVGRMGGNTFQEFWPDVRRRVFRRKPSSPAFELDP